jgi:UDP-glucose 4-epimerase
VIRCLVTGAAGFLGFHLVRALAQRNDVDIVAVDSFARGERDVHFTALMALPNVTFIEADLSDAGQVTALPNDMDIVFHLAALNGTQNFYERPLEVIRCCTLPTMLLAEKYGRAGIKRFLYAGTSESYASTVTRFNWPVPTAEDVPLSIDDVTNPRWSYAISKIRYHNAYGPRMGDKHVVPDFYARMREGRYELFGHQDTRSFLYADDAIRATVLVAETPECENEIINIGGTTEVTMHELGKAMMAGRALTDDIILHDSPAGSVKRRAPVVEKLKRLTGFSERVSLEDGLAATARFYLEDELVGPLSEI